MDVKDYEEELKNYSIEVINWLISKGVKPYDAQDVVQDVFIKMLETDLFIPPSSLRSWMYRVSLNTYIDLYRRDKKYQIILDSLKKEFHEVEIKEPKTMDINPFIKQLNTEEQELLKNYYYDEMSVKEIAKLKNYSESKVKTSLFRSRKKLKKLLKESNTDLSEWRL